jgi:predicted transcriptional regulator
VGKEAKRDFSATQADEKASACSARNHSESAFIAAVKRGIASAGRGDFIEHEEVLARIEGILNT